MGAVLGEAVQEPGGAAGVVIDQKRRAGDGFARVFEVGNGKPVPEGEEIHFGGIGPGVSDGGGQIGQIE